MVDAPHLFTVPYLYNGIKVAGRPHFVDCAENNFAHLGNCSDIRVCVIGNTPMHSLVAERLKERQIMQPTNIFEGFVNGTCNIYLNDAANIKERDIRDLGYTGEFAISTKSYSKDPLALAMRADDPKFAAFVNSVL